MQVSQLDTISSALLNVCIPKFIAKAPRWTTYLALTMDLGDLISHMSDVAGVDNKLAKLGKEP